MKMRRGGMGSLTCCTWSTSQPTNIGTARVCKRHVPNSPRPLVLEYSGTKSSSSNNHRRGRRILSAELFRTFGPPRVHGSLAILTLPDDPQIVFEPTHVVPSDPPKTSSYADFDCRPHFQNARWLGAFMLRPMFCVSSTLRYAGMSCALLTHLE